MSMMTFPNWDTNYFPLCVQNVMVSWQHSLVPSLTIHVKGRLNPRQKFEENRIDRSLIMIQLWARIPGIAPRSVQLGHKVHMMRAESANHGSNTCSHIVTHDRRCLMNQILDFYGCDEMSFCWGFS